MTSSSHLRDGDVDRMLALIADAPGDDPGPAMPWDTMAALLGIIECDDNSQYQEIDVVHERSPVCQTLGADGHRDLWDASRLDQALVDEVEQNELERLTWTSWWADPMCSYPQRSGDRRSVFHTGDFYPTRRDLLNRPARLHRPHLPSAVLVIQLPAAPGFERRLTFARGGERPFDERDRQVAQMLRPHLQEIWSDAERRRAGVPRLTPREWQVLTLVAAGLSFAEVASRLVLSVGTVRKHMEHVRERLGVHNAAAAARLAMPHAPGRSRVPAPSSAAAVAAERSGDR